MENGFGSRLTVLIEKLGMKKYEFAEQIKVDQSYVTQLTNGKRKPSVRLLETICSKFDVNKDWLRYGTEPMFLAKSRDALDAFIRERNLTLSDRILIEKFVSLNAKARWEVVKYVLSVADALWEECYASVHNGEKPDTPRRAEIATTAEELKRQNQELAAKIDIAAEVASYKAELELQEKVEEKSLAFDGSSGTAGAKMA